MARRTARVEEAVLVDDAEPPIEVGSHASYEWLTKVTTFAFAHATGRFTARKERSGSNDRYWKAYHKQAGSLHRAYLGKSADQARDRLSGLATDLAERIPIETSGPLHHQLRLPRSLLTCS